jgi:hypothetical protein
MKSYVSLWYVAEFFLEWEMFQTKVVEKIKTRVLCYATPPRKSYRLWDNVEKYCRADRPQMATQYCACVLTRATDTQSEYVIFTAFTRQQWLHERASVSRLDVFSNFTISFLYVFLCCLFFLYSRAAVSTDSVSAVYRGRKKIWKLKK